jgi:hypothetical protein
MEDTMPIYITYEPIRGEDGKAAPSTGELTVSKSMDMTSTPLFYGDQSNDSFDFGDTGQTQSSHTGGMQVVLGDGSVRSFGDGSVRFISDSIDPLPGEPTSTCCLTPSPIW